MDIDKYIDEIRTLYNDASELGGSTLLNIVLIILFAYFIQRASRIVIKKIIKQSLKSEHKNPLPTEAKKREKTLVDLASSISSIVIWILAILLVLSELGIEIAPLIAGVSFVGIAVGFGAQSLIKDFVSGMFIILENQFRVGDIVKVAGVGGQVESIGLRTTVLRDLDGHQHHVPNGIIDVASNLTAGYANINMNIAVAYDSDLDKVQKIIDEVGTKLAQDPDWKSQILKAPHFLRIDQFNTSSVDIKILGKVSAGKQWPVAGELRKRIAEAFAVYNIEIPYAQVVVHPSEKHAKSLSKKPKPRSSK